MAFGILKKHVNKYKIELNVIIFVFNIRLSGKIVLLDALQVLILIVGTLAYFDNLFDNIFNGNLLVVKILIVFRTNVNYSFTYSIKVSVIALIGLFLLSK